MKRSVVVILALGIVAAGAIGSGLWYAEQQSLAAKPDVHAAGDMLVKRGLLSRIDRVDYYSAGPVFYVYTGVDDSGRVAYVWVQGGQPVMKQYADDGLSATQAMRAAAAAQPPLVQLIHAVPGLTEPGASGPGDPPGTSSQRRVLWELFGLTRQGAYEYVYVDFHTGAVVRTYLLES
ncbi:hypothetical protein [Kyrpidia spormannii]|uniref:Uncharacterized protein n=2 Tax=Kyrpidia spormannii TaxID=2055160 RepID=A0ACA8ZA13_9BACL|nr:hypothetical protein [Kyrpidia spormannii]CAB3392156.1 conserved protein of unknown function [Kyrpidia spormannii]CAB3393076.1 conserved protein of unknown function [Kyrpidia spormannii]